LNNPNELERKMKTFMDLLAREKLYGGEFTSKPSPPKPSPEHITAK
jgi:hypothetical protein